MTTVPIKWYDVKSVHVASAKRMVIKYYNKMVLEEPF